MNYEVMQFFGSDLNNCPPSDAKPAFGIVYYLVWNNPPEENDFKPGIIKHPKVYGRKEEDELCQAHGFSVFKDINDALQNRKRCKNLRDTQLAVGKLTPEYGRIKKTCGKNNSHFTWWPPVGMDIWSLFTIVTE